MVGPSSAPPGPKSDVPCFCGPSSFVVVGTFVVVGRTTVPSPVVRPGEAFPVVPVSCVVVLPVPTGRGGRPGPPDERELFLPLISKP